MYCVKCGNKLNIGNNFCANCGEKVMDVDNIENAVQDNIIVENIVNDNVINEDKDIKRETSKKIDKNVNKNRIVSYFANNFSSKYEKILLVGEAVLSSIFMYYLFKGFGLVVAAFMADILFMVFIVSFGGEPFMFTEKAMIEFENTFPIFLVVLLFYSLFYLIICNLLRKEYKSNIDLNNRGIKVNKTKYMLTLYFLGIFGVHRFIINDKFGGKIRLGLFLFTVLSICLYPVIEGFSFILFILLLGCSMGLEMADIIIAKTKMSDNEKNIYV